jgi:hypothetical protein
MLIHEYNTDKSLPCADEYWSFAFYGWLLLEHDKSGNFVEIRASYATNTKIRIEEIINGDFSGNYDDYTIVGYKIREDKLRENQIKIINHS